MHAMGGGKILQAFGRDFGGMQEHAAAVSLMSAYMGAVVA